MRRSCPPHKLTQPATVACEMGAQSEYVHVACTVFFFARLAPIRMLRRHLSTKISASVLSQKFIESALLVGWLCTRAISDQKNPTHLSSHAAGFHCTTSLWQRERERERERERGERERRERERETDTHYDNAFSGTLTTTVKGGGGKNLHNLSLSLSQAFSRALPAPPLFLPDQTAVTPNLSPFPPS